MKRVRLLSALEKSLQSRMPDHDRRQDLVMGLTCTSVGLVLSVAVDVGAGAQTAIALASLWRERSN